MAQISQTSLTRYDLTDQEQTVGSIFTQEQMYVLQNLLADLSEEKINLKVDSASFNSYIQQEAELQGKIGIIKYLIENSLVTQQEQSIKLEGESQ